MRLQTFCDKYELNYTSFLTMKAKGRFKDSFLEKDGKFVMIDESFFKRRKEFQMKVWSRTHDMFYFLTKHIHEDNVAKAISVIEQKDVTKYYTQFFKIGMFKTIPNSIILTEVPSVLWRCFRYFSWIINKIFRVVGVKRENRDLEALINEN